MTVTRFMLEKLEEELVKAGSVPEQFFGHLGGTQVEQSKGVHRIYRQYLRACHPDVAEDGDKGLASQVFQELHMLKTLAEQKIDRGAYGDSRPEPLRSAYVPTTLTFGHRSVQLTGLIGEGTIATVHRAESGDGESGAMFLKVARDPADNDLLEREYRAILAICQPDPDPALEETFFRVQRSYVPAPVASLFVHGGTGKRHRAGIYRVPEGRRYTGAELRRSIFVDGIEPKHVWWIFRRLLLTLWLGHVRGYVHGAVTPDHLLIYPEAHGLVLLDWTNASRIDEENIPAVDPDYESFYPPEVCRKVMATPTIDLYMAAATAIYLLGGDIETGAMPSSVSLSLQDTLRACLDPNPRRRPQDAEEFHNRFGKLLGKRAFAEMIIP